MNKVKNDIITSQPTLLARYKNILVPTGIVLVTWLFLKVCINNQLTNWDDPTYITSDPLIKNMSWEGLKAIFSLPVAGNYHPLTILSYAIEYSFAELEPQLYHVDSLLLHLAVTLLVYHFAMRLTKKYLVAAITALLFGLHPMHVESVAWVSGRKDELCALFYFGACLTYLNYLDPASRKKYAWYVLVLVLFVCALLSKATAVTLPFLLLAIDHYEKRPLSKKTMGEKVPLFVLSVLFGILSVNAQRTIGALNSIHINFSIPERVALGAYSIVTYLWKAVVPANLHCFYVYPETVQGHLPALFYIYPVIVAVLSFAIIKFAWKNRAVIFGSLFFLLNIFLLLQFIPVGNAIVAERYSYIPYFGLFFIAANYINYIIEQNNTGQYGNIVRVGIFAYIALLGAISFQRCKIWYDSVTLWTEEIARESHYAPAAYANLGFVYYDRWYSATDPAIKQTAFDSACYLMKRSIALRPDTVAPYQPLGMLYYSTHNYDSADYCFKTALRLAPSPDGYSNYGNLLVMMHRDDSAIRQYDIAISQNPDLFGPYFNRGKIYRRKNRMENAMKDFNTAMAIRPSYAELYYERSFCDTQLLNKTFALKDVEKAISLGYNKVDSGYYNLLKK